MDERKVFISHTTTSELFADAAVEACNEAAWVPVDMRWFTAADLTPSANDARKVRECSVFAALLGLDYGSPARDRPDRSYCELEWDDAIVAGLVRLAYLQRGEPDDNRQRAFRQAMLASGVTVGWYTDPVDLRHQLYKALSEMDAESSSTAPSVINGAMHVHVDDNNGIIAQEVNGPITFDFRCRREQ